MITFPTIDPVFIEIGPLAIRWYSLAYLVGILLGAAYIKKLNKTTPTLKDFNPFDDLLFYSIIGIILGGRLGYVIFYQLDYYLAHPAEILQLWNGGMSFHGGFIGFALGLWYLARKKNYPFLALADFCAAAAPIGIGLGRLANFINGELFGRTTDVPWAMIFPGGGPLPRHPSQLYEALTEGLILFVILAFCALKLQWRQYHGRLTGMFLLGYGCARFICEFFREPDAQLGHIIGFATQGQLLSLPMVILGIIFLIKAKKQYGA